MSPELVPELLLTLEQRLTPHLGGSQRLKQLEGRQMTADENQKLESLKQEVEQYEDESIGPIPFSLLDKKNNRTTKLVSTSGDVQPIDGRRRWHDFSFKEPFLVTSVTIETEGYGDGGEFKFAWKSEDGGDHVTEVRSIDSVITVQVNDICKSIHFRPPTTFFSRTKILSISIEGLKLRDVPAALDSLGDLEAFKTDMLAIVDEAVARQEQILASANTAKVEREQLVKEIATLKQSRGRLNKNIIDLTTAKNELIASNGAAETALNDAGEKTKKLRGENDNFISSVTELTSKIQTDTQTLSELKNNINIFPTEIVEFVNQGSKNIQQYLVLAGLPIAIIGIMFLMLINGAANLTTIVTNNPDVNIGALMLSRLPYVSIATVIITAC